MGINLYGMMLKILLYGFVVLQLSGALRSIVKSVPKVSRQVISPSGKIIKNSKNLNRASLLLLGDDVLSIEKKLTVEEKALAGSSDGYAMTGKNAMKESALVGKSSKATDRLKREVKKLTREKIEESIEELIFENLDRTGSLFENSVHELLNEPKFTSVAGHLEKRYGFELKRKVDLFLLMNEKAVDGFRLNRRSVSGLLARYSDIYTGRALGFLVVDLAEYGPVCEFLMTYASSRNLREAVRAARLEMAENPENGNSE